MRIKHVYVIAAVLLVSIVLAGCSQAAGRAGNQPLPAVQGVSEQKPLSTAAVKIKPWMRRLLLKINLPLLRL